MIALSVSRVVGHYGLPTGFLGVIDEFAPAISPSRVSGGGRAFLVDLLLNSEASPKALVGACQSPG